MYDCDLNGHLKDIDSPVVVWRDETFVVVSESKDDENTYDVGFIKIDHNIELPILDVDLVDGFNTKPKNQGEEGKSIISSGISDDGDQALN
jgi:hypothetical protein